MKIALSLLLVVLTSTRLPAQATPTSQPQSLSTGATAPDAPPDPALRESLVMVQAVAQKSDADIGRLRIDKWKADGQNKQQSQANATSIRRNLTNAIPDLLLRIQKEPGSLIANFRLYRNLNALYDSFSALAESAGAFGPGDQYAPLAADLGQLDQLRRQFAERVDLLAGASDAELARLRDAKAAKPAAPPKPASRIVVDDSKSTPNKRKPKPTPKPTPAAPQPVAPQ